MLYYMDEYSPDVLDPKAIDRIGGTQEYKEKEPLLLQKRTDQDQQCDSVKAIRRSCDKRRRIRCDIF
jgi:hypothetical protein